MSQTRIQSPSRPSHRNSVISSWRRVEKIAKATIFCIGTEEGRMLPDAAKVLHQAVEFFKGWPALALDRFSYQAELSDDGDGVVERLAR